MALTVNSRFAVLSIDDDDDVKRSSKKKTNSNNNPSSQKNDSKKKDGKKPNNTKSQSSVGNQSTNSKSKTSKANKKKANADEKQWEQWKRKDEEMVNGNYENELHEAMLLSQLDFEKKKEIYAAAAAQAKEQEANTNKKEKEKKQKKNKPITMSLSEFNNLMEPPQTQESGGKGDGPGANAVEEADPEFFDRVKEDAKKVLHHEKQVEKRKAREPFVNQELALARLEEKLERKEKEVVQLSEEVTRLKEELKTVRARNRDLCLIMSQGEMKDKAEVLVAMEKTTMVKDELSGEVERLHALLEQERSKVRALTQNSDKNKKGKKRTASENN